jgi:hypothetical protein
MSDQIFESLKNFHSFQELPEDLQIKIISDFILSLHPSKREEAIKKFISIENNRFRYLVLSPPIMKNVPVEFNEEGLIHQLIELEQENLLPETYHLDVIINLLISLPLDNPERASDEINSYRNLFTLQIQENVKLSEILLKTVISTLRHFELEVDTIDFNEFLKFSRLKTLELGHLRKMQTLDLRPLSHLKEFENLIISFWWKDNKPYMKYIGLETLSNLKSLVLWRSDIRNTPLKFLRYLKNLRLAYCHFNFEELHLLSSLETLEVDGATSLEFLRGLSSLKSLILEECPGDRHANKIDLYPLVSLTNLNSLNISSSMFNSLSPIGNLISLKELRIQGGVNFFDDKSFNFIEKLENIEILHIHIYKMRTLNLDMSKLRKIKNFSVSL